MQGDGGAGLQQLAVEGGQDPHIVVGACGGSHNTRVAVHHLQELANDQRHRLDPLHLLLCAQELALEAPLLLLDVLLLQWQCPPPYKHSPQIRGVACTIQITIYFRKAAVEKCCIRTCSSTTRQSQEPRATGASRQGLHPEITLQ